CGTAAEPVRSRTTDGPAGGRDPGDRRRRKERRMKFVAVGGTRISAIGLGCWQFGSKDWGYGNRYAQEVAVELVHTALDLGVNLIDTAEVYAHGVSETIVGRALVGRRSDAFVATKVLPVMPTAD